MLSKIRSFFIGWFTLLFKKRSSMTNERLETCWKCNERKGYFCGQCGCELHAKASSKEETCPLDKWHS